MFCSSDIEPESSITNRMSTLLQPSSTLVPLVGSPVSQMSWRLSGSVFGVKSMYDVNVASWVSPLLFQDARSPIVVLVDDGEPSVVTMPATAGVA